MVLGLNVNTLLYATSILSTTVCTIILGLILLLVIILHLDTNMLLIVGLCFIVSIIITFFVILGVTCSSEGIKLKTLFTDPSLVYKSLATQFEIQKPDPLWVTKQNIPLEEFSKMSQMMDYYEMMHSDHPMVTEAVKNLKMVWELAKPNK